MEKIRINTGVFEYRDSIKVKKDIPDKLAHDICFYFEVGGGQVGDEIQLATGTPISDEAAEERFRLIRSRLDALGYI